MFASCSEYKRYLLLFRLLLAFCTIAINVAAVDSAEDAEGRILFCEKLTKKFLENDPEFASNQPFSFIRLLRLQGFTFQKVYQMLMIADNYAYTFKTTEMLERPSRLRINRQNYLSLWTNRRHSDLAHARNFELSPDDRFDMAYHLDVKNYFWRTNFLVIVFTEKRIMAIDEDGNEWGMSVKAAAQSPRFYHSVPVKLITDYVGFKDMQAYAVSGVPGKENESGLIIYSFHVSVGTAISYECTWNLIDNYVDLATKKYFYLQRSIVPHYVRLVHPKVGNLTAAKLYPLTRNAMSGYILGTAMYLFDVELGCVYILPKWNRIDLDAKYDEYVDIITQRINVPFEIFFNCTDVPISPMFNAFPKYRCASTIDSDSPYMMDVLANEHLAQEEIDENVQVWAGNDSTNSSRKIVFTIICILVLICVLVRCLILIRRRRFTKNKIDNKNASDSGTHYKAPIRSKINIKKRSPKSSSGCDGEAVESKKSTKSSISAGGRNKSRTRSTNINTVASK